MKERQKKQTNTDGRRRKKPFGGFCSLVLRSVLRWDVCNVDLSVVSYCSVAKRSWLPGTRQH